MEQSFRHSSLSARQRVAVNSARASEMHSFRDTQRFFIFLVDSMARIEKITDETQADLEISIKYKLLKNQDKNF